MLRSQLRLKTEIEELKNKETLLMFYGFINGMQAEKQLMKNKEKSKAESDEKHT